MTYKRRVIYLPFFFYLYNRRERMIPFFFWGMCGENLRNPLIFTIFVYANKGFAYSICLTPVTLTDTKFYFI